MNSVNEFNVWTTNKFNPAIRGNEIVATFYNLEDAKDYVDKQFNDKGIELMICKKNELNSIEM